MRFIESQIPVRQRPLPRDPEHIRACHSIMAFTDSIIAKWVTIQQPDFATSATGPVNNTASITTPYTEDLALEWRMSRAGLYRTASDNNPLIANILVWRNAVESWDDEEQTSPLIEYRLSSIDVSYRDAVRCITTSLDTPQIDLLLHDLQDSAQQLVGLYRS